MKIFRFESYKDFVNNWIEELPNNGRGEYRRIANQLQVSTTMVSQVFRGDKHLSLELANDLADYLNLNDLETDYFFLLVECSRAGTTRLKQRLEKRIKLARAHALKLETRMTKDTEMNETTMTQFYSSWIYSGIRAMAALPGVNDAQEIATRLSLPRTQVQNVLEFLISNGLVLHEDGQLKVGPKQTHIGADSPLVAKHHQNWRLLGFHKMALNDTDNMFWTGPMSLSIETAELIRAELPNFIERISKMVLPSPSETTRCLTIDWFSF